jgi:hypothetical protein
VSRMRRQFIEAWGEFLSQFKWDWFVTLTFREEPPTFRAHRLVRFFLADLERVAGTPIFWFRADDYGERLGRFHIHLLVGNVGHMRRLSWMDEWNRRAGIARIDPFDGAKGAAFYCAKYVAKQCAVLEASDNWELSDNMDVFRSNQPALPLRGATKISETKPQPEPLERTKKLGERKQLVLPPVLDWAGQRIQRLPEDPMFMKVYRSEVTRGQGRFRQFFVPSKGSGDE